MGDALIGEPAAVLAVLFCVLAAIFGTQNRPGFRRVYRVLPVLLFCYFVPTTLSNTGLIPYDPSFELYVWIKEWLLPASLVLLILAVDIPGILGLGRRVLILFFTAVVSIVLGGPLAYLILGGLIAPEYAAQAWRGLAALSGSWIGGGANMTAIKESVGASDDIFAIMVVVDVAIANTWMAVLLFFAGREERMDRKLGADRAALDEIKVKAEEYAAQTSRPTDLKSLLTMGALAFGGTAVAHGVAPLIEAALPENDIVNAFTWKVILVTLLGLGLSFTRARDLEGAGASKVGSVFLYLLVATIGAKARFSGILDEQNLPLALIGALWMLFHATAILVVRRLLRAPIFFAAVGSQSCVGGAASAPIVAAAFSPALAPVGVLLAIAGYVFGTVGGIACAFLLEAVSGVYAGP